MEVETIPKSADLLAVIALLSEEADCLRDRIGSCQVRFTKRIFTRNDLDYGRSLCAVTNKLPNGSVELKIES